MHRKISVSILVMFISMFIAAFGLSAKDVEKVTLKLQWLDQFQFAGYYVAKEKGFFQDAGLNVEIIPYTDGKQNVVEDVTTGIAQYGTGRSSLIVDKMAGKPVVLLAAIFQDSPAVLLTRKDTGIETISDLIGRRIMISSDALVSADVIGMLAEEGVRPHDVIAQRHSYNLDDLIDKNTDAMACYISNEPYHLKEANIAFRTFAPKDFGQDYYGDLLFTSKREARFHPDRVKAFKKASLKGWAYAFDNIEETARLIQQSYNGQEKSLKSLVFEGQELKKLAYKKDINLGHISMDKIQEITDLFHSKGMFEDKSRLDGFIFGQ